MSTDEISVISALPDPMCLVNTRGEIIAANDAIARFYESELSVLQDKTLFDLVTDSKDKVKQHLRNWSRSRATIPGPLNLRINGSKSKPCNCSGSLLKPKTKDSPAVILLRIEPRENFSQNFTLLNNKIIQLQKEITNRQQTEQALKKSKAEFEAMFNSLPDAVIFADIDRRIVMTSPSAESMFGYSEDELLGQTTELFYVDNSQFQDQGKRRYNPGKNTDKGVYEIQYKRKDGSLFWSETLGTQVVNENGKIIGLTGLIRDISERKQAEEEIRKYRDHLEELVKERTIALENSNKELEAYSYSIAHDLRSPLRSISSFSQILKQDAENRLNAEDIEHLNRIIRSATHMAELIDDILELSRVARSEIQFENINLSSVCQDISNALQMENQDRKVDYEIQADVTVKGDYHLLYTVMKNLLSNALKFTTNQERAKIEFGQNIIDGEKVYFVRDNGIGFDMKFANKLFGLFQRLHRPDEFEGTGVGLATVRRIIERHKGWVKIEGVVDNGATVYFSIPE